VPAAGTYVINSEEVRPTSSAFGYAEVDRDFTTLRSPRRAMVTKTFFKSDVYLLVMATSARDSIAQ
jgi:hypothetical protein